MRVHGRTIHASTPDERRLLQGLGVESIHIPRRENPYRVARKIEQLIKRHREEMFFLHELVKNTPKPTVSQTSMDREVPDQEQGDAVAT